MSDSLISKIWNYCHTLRDDGLSYGEYLEQMEPLRQRILKKAFEGRLVGHEAGACLPTRHVGQLRCC